MVKAQSAPVYKFLQEHAMNSNNNEPIVRIQGVTREYLLGKVKVPALRGIDLDISKGSLMSVIGPSGSGKTTLMNIIGLIDNPSSGTIEIHGKSIADMNDEQCTDMRLNTIGFIFQTFNLIPVLNALENVEFPMLLKNEFSPADIRTKALGLLETVGLKEFYHHRPAELSGGQRQRVAIARALITDPDIILADEPTANLDSVTGNNILKLMREINQTRGTTFVFSTHNKEVLDYADRIVTLQDGKIRV